MSESCLRLLIQSKYLDTSERGTFLKYREVVKKYTSDSNLILSHLSSLTPTTPRQTDAKNGVSLNGGNSFKSLNDTISKLRGQLASADTTNAQKLTYNKALAEADEVVECIDAFDVNWVSLLPGFKFKENISARSLAALNEDTTGTVRTFIRVWLKPTDNENVNQNITEVTNSIQYYKGSTNDKDTFGPFYQVLINSKTIQEAYIKNKLSSAVEMLAKNYHVVLFGYGASGTGKTHNLDYISKTWTKNGPGFIVKIHLSTIAIENETKSTKSKKTIISGTTLTCTYTVKQDKKEKKQSEETAGSSFEASMRAENSKFNRATPNNPKSTRCAIIQDYKKNDYSMTVIDLPGNENFNPTNTKKHTRSDFDRKQYPTDTKEGLVNNLALKMKIKQIVYRDKSKLSFTQVVTFEGDVSYNQRYPYYPSKKNGEQFFVTIPEFVLLAAESYWINKLLKPDSNDDVYGNIASFLKHKQLDDSEHSFLNYAAEDKVTSLDQTLKKSIGEEVSLKYVMLATVVDLAERSEIFKNFNIRDETLNTLKFADTFSSSSKIEQKAKK